MKNKKYRVSRATLYNTVVILLDCHLIRKHQFGKNQAQFERALGNKQHDHIILTDSGEVLEFCDPRIQNIKQTKIVRKEYYQLKCTITDSNCNLLVHGIAPYQSL